MIRITNDMNETLTLYPQETVVVQGDTGEDGVVIQSAEPEPREPDEPCECPQALREIGLYKATEEYPHTQYCNRCGGYVE